MTVKPGALPRGPHELSREQVADSQRSRLIVAFTELMADEGYVAVRVAELVRRAGVSKATFYEHFSDKEQCMLAAYEQYLQTLLAGLAPLVSDDSPTLDDFVANVLSAYVAVIDGDRTAARAFFVEVDAAGRVARARRRHERQAFITLLAGRHEEFRRRDATLGTLPPIAFEAIIDAAREIVRDRLDSEPDPDLRGLIPGLTVTFAALLRGAHEPRH